MHDRKNVHDTMDVRTKDAAAEEVECIAYVAYNVTLHWLRRHRSIQEQWTIMTRTLTYCQVSTPGTSTCRPPRRLCRSVCQTRQNQRSERSVV